MNGDIKLSEINHEEFSQLSHNDQHWLQFKSVQGLCDQPGRCDKKYVQVHHVKIFGIALLALGVGLGIINWQDIVKFLG